MAGKLPAICFHTPTNETTCESLDAGEGARVPLGQTGSRTKAMPPRASRYQARGNRPSRAACQLSSLPAAISVPSRSSGV